MVLQGALYLLLPLYHKQASHKRELMDLQKMALVAAFFLF